MGSKNHTGIKRIIYAAGYSMAGLFSTFKQEAAFRQEVALFTLMIPLSFWIGDNAIEKALLIGSCFIVMITELLNSAIETVVDRISEKHHELSKQAKDMGSAAVLLSLMLTGIVWGFIVFENFF